jgi:hypothetical protein
MEKTEKEINMFDLFKSVSHTKKDMLADDPANIKKYSGYMANKNFSLFSDTILYANEMNVCHNLDPDMQYQYYMHSLKKRNRYKAWPKSMTDVETIKNVQKFYDCNFEVAKLYLTLLDQDDINYINKLAESKNNNG